MGEVIDIQSTGSYIRCHKDLNPAFSKTLNHLFPSTLFNITVK